MNAVQKIILRTSLNVPHAYNVKYSFYFFCCLINVANKGGLCPYCRHIVLRFVLCETADSVLGHK